MPDYPVAVPVCYVTNVSKQRLKMWRLRRFFKSFFSGFIDVNLKWTSGVSVNAVNMCFMSVCWHLWLWGVRFVWCFYLDLRRSDEGGRKVTAVVCVRLKRVRGCGYFLEAVHTQLCSVCVSTWSVVCSPAPFLIALRNRWGSASSSVWFNFSRHQQVLLGNNSQRWPWSDNTITKGANHNTLTRVANRQTQGWVHSQGSLVFVCPTLA